MSANYTHLYDLQCEGRMIAKNRTATQIATLMGIAVGQVPAYARGGDLVNGRYKIIKNPEKLDPQLAYLLCDWDKITEPFRRVIWCKHMADGVRKLEVKPR